MKKMLIICAVLIFAVGNVFAQTIDWKGITWDVLKGTATVDGSGNLVLTTDGTNAAQVHVNRIPTLIGVTTPWIELSYMDVTTANHKIDMTMDDEGGLNPRFAVGSLWSVGEVVAMRRQSSPTYETYLFLEDTRQDIERTVYVGKRASGTLDVNFDGKKRSSAYLNEFVGGTWEYKDVYLRLRADASGETVTFTDFTYGTDHANQTPTDFLVTQDDQGTVMSIQKAVDESADGDVINVAAGTYQTDISIDKSLTIVGDISGPCPGPGSNAPEIVGTNSGNERGFIIEPGVDDVTIEGFVIRNLGGTPNTGGGACGIFAWGTNADPNENITIRYNKFQHIRWANVFFFNLGHSTFNNILVDCNIIEMDPYSDNANLYGIEFTNCTNSTISNNQVTGGYTGLLITAQVEEGIPIVMDGISIIGNTVTGSVGWIGNVGIVSYPNGLIENMTITGNILADGSYAGEYWGGGIVAYSYPGSSFAGSFNVNNNSITGNTSNGILNRTGITWNATCNWWGAADGPSGSGGGSGDAVSDNITYLPWLVALDGSCADGTLGIKQGVRNYLAGLLTTDDKKDNGLIDKAIKHINRSLDSDLWIDPSHLTAKGKKVFEEEKKAVHELMKVKNLAVSGSITTLVEVDKMLAQTAIDEAENDKDKEKAEVEMGKALDEIVKGNFDKAVEHYKQAWHHATKALKHLAKYNAFKGSQFEDSAIPDVFGLKENYPNPFNPTTLISYNLPEASQVTMTVYDLMGRKVKTLVQGFQPAGNHSVIWNATNDNGDIMSGGMYFYQIKAGSFQKTHKMILLK